MGVGRQGGIITAPGPPDVAKQATDVETLIFLDVDGVLNVGICDPGESALLLNDVNLFLARRLLMSSRKLESLPAAMRDMVVRTAVAACRALPDGDKTYEDLACCNGCEVSEELVSRLASIIQDAGSNVQVVLTSTWRLPKYHERLSKLEEMLSVLLKQPFTFDQKTRECIEHGGLDRLRTLGDHMEMLGMERDTSRPLKVLVLDDFSITGFSEGSLDIDGATIRCPEDAAAYLCRRYSPSEWGSVPLECAVIHTYDAWTVQGITVQMGSGLTLKHVCEATQFFNLTCGWCLKEEEEEDSTTTPPSTCACSCSDSEELPYRSAPLQ